MHQGAWITGFLSQTHNSFGEYFPKNQYGDRTEYYSNDLGKTQLCYTAHGNPEILAEMQTIVVERMKTMINDSYSKGNFFGSIGFTHQDVNSWCTCESCTEMKEAHGAALFSVRHA